MADRVHYATSTVTACRWLLRKPTGPRTVSPGKVTCPYCQRRLNRQLKEKTWRK